MIIMASTMMMLPIIIWSVDPLSQRKMSIQVVISKDMSFKMIQSNNNQIQAKKKLTFWEIKDIKPLLINQISNLILIVEMMHQIFRINKVKLVKYSQKILLKK